MPTSIKKIKDIDGQDVLTEYAKCDSAGNIIKTTYLKKNDLSTICGKNIKSGGNVSIDFEDITGSVSGNASLTNALNEKADASDIPTDYVSTSAQELTSEEKTQVKTNLSIVDLPAFPADLTKTYVLKLTGNLLFWEEE